MNRRRGLVAYRAFAMASALAVSSPTIAQDASAVKAASARSEVARTLVGTWRVTSYSQLDVATNKVATPVGEHPLGAIQFSPGGHVSVLITARKRVIPRVPYSDADRSAIFRDIATAYVGTYRVQGSKVTVRETAALRPDGVGADHIRYAEIKGRTLTLRNSPAISSRTGKKTATVVTAEREE
jgi:hypothetical protein